MEGKRSEEVSPKCAIQRYSRRGVNYYSLHFSLYLSVRKFVHNFGKKKQLQNCNLQDQEGNEKIIL